MATGPKISRQQRPQGATRPIKEPPKKPKSPGRPDRRPAKGDPAYNPDVTHAPNDPNKRPLPQR
jgi:hypothetical protein